jgi:hypothetical protein
MSSEAIESVILFGMFLRGTVAPVVGVFMWQGGWAALAALGLFAALFAASQANVLATSAGARSIVRKIVRAQGGQ